MRDGRSKMRVLAFLLIALCSTSASANATPMLTHSNQELDEILEIGFVLTPEEEELAWRISLVSANEGALWNLMTVALVHQVVITNAYGLDRQIAFLEEHSGRVLGKRPCPETGNCVWVRQLARTAGTLPVALMKPDSEIKDWKAYWKIEMAPRWRRVMAVAQGLVSRDLKVTPCSKPPRSWGSLRSNLPDLRVAERNGLYPIGCAGSGPRRNDGFAPLEAWPFWDLPLAVQW